MSIEWPLASVNISQGYGPGHHGIDLAAPAGTPIYATDSGVVEANGWGQNHSWMLSPAGIFVLLRHSWGYSGYAHMTSFAVNVGQSVARGQLIGYVGATGAATGPHVHFEIFPPSPNWSNGYSGRISPYTQTIVPHGTATPPPTPNPTPEKPEENMRPLIVQNLEGTAATNANYGMVAAIFPSGFFKTLTGTQRDAWRDTAGVKIVETKVTGHFDYFIATAKELAAANK